MQRWVELTQYTSDDFQQLLKAQGTTCSMSRKGNCWDNAAMESSFSSMKTERLSRKVYRTREAARSDVFEPPRFPRRLFGLSHTAIVAV